MVLASGFAPTGVAEDGSRDVFFGSFGAGSNPAGLYEIPSGGSATLVTSYFGELQSLAVDGNGDVWGADGAQGLVVVPPGTVGEGVGITGGVNGIRLDAANNLFATTAFGDDAIEVPAGSVDATDLGNIGSYSQGIAVDTSGDVFVGASAGSYPYGKVYEIPPGGSPKVCASNVATTGGLALYPALVPASRSASTVMLSTTSASNVTTRTTVQLSATVPAGETGGVQFDDNGNAIGDAVATSGGTASITTRLSAGSHTITATYLGDASTAPAVSNSLSFTSKAIATKTVLSVPSGTTVPGDQQVTVDAQVSGWGGTPTGYVSFYDWSRYVGSATLDSSGHASIELSPIPGSNNVHASYSGDSVFSPSNSAKTMVTTTTPYPTTLRTSVRYTTPNTKGTVRTAIRVVVPGVQGVPGTTGTITASNGFTCRALVQVPGTHNSAAVCRHWLAAGADETVTIAFTSGDGNYDSSSTQVYVANYTEE